MAGFRFHSTKLSMDAEHKLHELKTMERATLKDQQPLELRKSSREARVSSRRLSGQNLIEKNERHIGDSGTQDYFKYEISELQQKQKTMAQAQKDQQLQVRTLTSELKKIQKELENFLQGQKQEGIHTSTKKAIEAGVQGLPSEYMYPDLAIKRTTPFSKKPPSQVKKAIGDTPSLEATREFNTLTLSSEESSLCKRGDPSVMLTALEARHASVIQASQFDSNQQLKRREELINYVMKLSPKDTSSLWLLPKEHTSGIGYKSITDMNVVLRKLGLDTTPASQFEKSRLTERQISEDEVIPAYLKEASRQTQALHQKKDRVYCVVPYHYSGQTAVVIYAHDPAADLHEKNWSKEFLGFPVYIVNLTYGYASDPLIFPECLPQIPDVTYEKCSEIKDEVTRELTKTHSNISTVCVDYRIKGNKIVESEICIQIGVLTKGFVPLGEKCLPRIFNDVAVDVIESNASFCVRVHPVKLGVGIGVERDVSSTGTLGAVVKLNEQPHVNELFILSCAHVLNPREVEGATLSITQPSQQDYERTLTDMRELQNTIALQNPRRIASFTAKPEFFVLNPTYRIKQKEYGIDAAIAKIERDQFTPEDMTRMYTWPDGLFDDSNIKEIQLNGKLMETISRGLRVFKCGRTTKVTKGVVYKEENVLMPDTMRWFNLLHIESTTKQGDDLKSFVEPGDSGSVVFDENGTCVGLVFGCTNKSIYRWNVGLAIPMHAVFQALGISLATPEDFNIHE